MLRAREGDVEHGIPIDPKVGLVTFHEAAEDMLNDYKANRKRTYVDAKRRINKHLAPFFGNKRLSSITASDIRAYVAKRMADTTSRGHRGVSETETARGRNSRKSEGLSPLARSIVS
jgi:hypothetical protein